MEGENQQGNIADASSGDAGQVPAAVQPTAKVEIKEGSVLVDGKKFVSESDLIAAKKSIEGKLTQAQTVHEQAIDKARIDLSAAQKQIAELSAKAKQMEEASKAAGDTPPEDVVKVKQELETSKASMEQISKSALEYRRTLLVLKYGVPEDTIKDKTMAQLDSFEEALKAVSASRGGSVGPYATGGGATSAAPISDMDRASRVLAATPVRGTRQTVEGK